MARPSPENLAPNYKDLYRESFMLMKKKSCLLDQIK